MALTRDVADRHFVTWLDSQRPNTLMMIAGSEPLVMSEERLTEIQNRHNRRGGLTTYLEAIKMRVGSWPSPKEPQGLIEARNTAAREMLDLAFRIYR